MLFLVVVKYICFFHCVILFLEWSYSKTSLSSLVTSVKKFIILLGYIVLLYSPFGSQCYTVLYFNSSNVTQFYISIVLESLLPTRWY